MTAWRAAPTAVAAALTVALAWREGGSIAVGDWLHYGVAVGLLVSAVLLSGGARMLRPAALAAVAALVGLAGWTALSAAWSPLPTLARDEGLLALTYALALALPALTLRGSADRVAALTAVVAAMTVVALVPGVALLAGLDPLQAFRGGRLYYPLTYVNAQAALSLVAFWPAVVLASRRSSPSLVRAIALAGAGAMAAGWLMTQSKGAAAGLVLSGAALFALCPARLRLLAPTILVAAPLAAAFRPLTATFGAYPDAAVIAAAGDAAAAQIAVAGAAFALGFAYALADARVKVDARTRRLAGKLALAGVLAALVAGAAAFVASTGDPRAFAVERWDEFKTLPGREEGGTHFVSLGSNRYDFWRVAAGEFADHPLAGIGGRGFAAAYLVEGSGQETPLRSHSLVLDVLAETGVVGFLLLAAGVGVPLAVAAMRLGRVPAAAAFGAGVYWVGHASVDWTWTFPASGIPLFLLLGIPLSSSRAPALRLRPSAAAGAAVLVVTLGALGLPWVSARFADRALDARGDAARRDLAWARRLDPLSVNPLVAEALVAPSPQVAIPPLERAVEKEPRNATVRYLLGVEYLRRGRTREARETLTAALALQPGSELVRRALRRAQ